MTINGDDVIERLERVEKTVDSIDKKLDAVEKKGDEFADATKIQFENVREDIKKLGERYEQGLRSISNQIKELDQSWKSTWSTHDLALKDHGWNFWNLG